MSDNFSLLSKDEVENISRSVFGENIESIDFLINRKSEKQLGFLGDHFVLNVRARVNGHDREKRFFIKTYPNVNVKQEDYISGTGLFEREANLYQQLIPKLQLIGDDRWCPEHYMSKDKVIVLEDISVDGYETAAKIIFNKKQVQLTLEKLSILHASSFILQDKEQNQSDLQETYPELLEEIIYSDKNQNNLEVPFSRWLSKGIQDLQTGTNWLQGYSPEEKLYIKEKLPQVLKGVYLLSKKSNKFKNTVIHGDVWANNILFRCDEKGEPVDCKLVDLQFVRYAPPAHDVMHLLHLSATKTFRDLEESELLLFYYKCLRERLETHGYDVNQFITMESFIESCQEQRQLAVMESLLGMHYVLAPIVPKLPPALNPQQQELFWEKCRSDYMKKYFEDESYRSRVSDIFHEFIDNYILTGT